MTNTKEGFASWEAIFEANNLTVTTKITYWIWLYNIPSR